MAETAAARAPVVVEAAGVARPARRREPSASGSPAPASRPAASALAEVATSVQRSGPISRLPGLRTSTRRPVRGWPQWRQRGRLKRAFVGRPWLAAPPLARARPQAAQTAQQRPDSTDPAASSPRRSDRPDVRCHPMNSLRSADRLIHRSRTAVGRNGLGRLGRADILARDLFRGDFSGEIR